MRELRCLLDGSHGADEPNPPCHGQDPAQASSGLVRLQRCELGHGGLDRRDLAEIDETGHRPDRPGEERRPRTRRSDDEHQPLVEPSEAFS